MIRAEVLAQELGVSIETVRRDLLALESEGAIRRVYGGVARVATSAAEPPFASRLAQNAEGKQMMAAHAVQMIQPGSTVAFDVGTSVAEVAKQLPANFHGRVVTTSLLVATELADREGIELIVVGGRVRGGDLACYGPEVVSGLRNYYYGVAFVGSAGVDPVAGLTDHYREEAAARRSILANSDETFVLADSSKLRMIAPVKVCDLSEVTAVITDAGADKDSLAMFAKASIQVLSAG
jgi:DeoR family transcriptional regulator, fructose operon transcriptional repressor